MHYSIDHQDVYDKALMRIDDIELSQMVEEDFYNSLNMWLRSFVADQRFRKMFSYFVMDDDMQTIEFELKNSIDETYDCEYVSSVLAKGLVLNYFPMKLEQSSYLNMIVYGGDEKIKDNYKNAQARLAVLRKEVDIEISQHSYYFGRYENGNKS